jgi:arylsulfatase A-like enzyme
MRMMNLLLTATIAVATLSNALAAAETKPNIIVVLVDDMGFSDLGCYGSEIPTPNLDALAANGLRFTQFYNTGRCCPTRAALLTGLYSHQAGVGHMVENKNAPGYVGRLNDQCATFAEVLKPAGYFAAMAGKWHVGQNQDVTPWSRGFERSLNAPAGGFYQAGSPRAELYLNGTKLAKDDARLPKGWYSTDLWTTFGLKFIDEAKEAKKPFFLYLAHNAPHFPLQAPAEEIAKFRGKYKEGWDKLRLQRHAKQLELGLIDKAWTVAPRPQDIKEWDSLTDEQKDKFDHLMAVYAATVSRMDKAMGDLTAGLKDRGVFENTLILFMSDNGGNAESGPNGRSSGDPATADSDWFCGESWAFLENTPFRRYKHFNHEGGIATPLIAHWPAGIKAKNELRKQPAHLIDIMATCVDVAGATPLKELNGKPVLPLEGRSLVPAFADKPIERDALYWEHEGNAAVRVGDLKLVRAGRNGTWELYDLAKDRTEQHDLASEQADKTKELAAKWESWAIRAQVKPYPNEGGGKKAGKKAGKKQDKTES